MNNINSVVVKWINIARWSPSGGNQQPWSVKVIDSDLYSEERIQLNILIDKETALVASPLDVHYSATLISLGCFVVSLEYAAKLDSYILEKRELIESDELLKTKVDLIFKKTSAVMNICFDENILTQRKTNREKFTKKPVDPKFISKINLLKSNNEQVKIVELKNRLGFFKAFFNIEKMRWVKNEYLDSFFDELDESNNKKTAIPINNLGLNLIDKTVLLGLKKNIPLRRFFQNYLSYFLTYKSLASYLFSGGEIFFLQIPNIRHYNCFTLGLMLQELWLEAERLSLGFQPIGTPLVICKFKNEDGKDFFNLKEKHFIAHSVFKIKNDVNLDFELPTLGFRVGYTKKKCNLTPRKEIEKILVS